MNIGRCDVRGESGDLLSRAYFCKTSTKQGVCRIPAQSQNYNPNQQPYPPPQQQNYNPNQRPYPQYAQPQQYYDPNQPQQYGR